MPTEQAKNCEGCNFGIVHRLCVPHSDAMEGKILCPKCAGSAFQTEASAKATAPESLAASVAPEAAASDVAKEAEPASKPRNLGGRPKGYLNVNKRSAKIREK